MTLDGGKGFGQAIGEAGDDDRDRARARARLRGRRPRRTRITSAASASGASSAPRRDSCRCISSTCARDRSSRRGAAPMRACRRIRSASRCRTRRIRSCSTTRPPSVALGKTRVAVDEGTRDGRRPAARPDRAGRRTIPSVMWGETIGAILPFAEHKGWALSVMCELARRRAERRARAGRRDDPSDAEQHADARVRSGAARYGRDAAGRDRGASPTGCVRRRRWPAPTRSRCPASPSGALRRPRTRDGIPMPRRTLDAARRRGEAARRRRPARRRVTHEHQDLRIARRRRGEAHLVRQALRARLRVHGGRRSRTPASSSATTRSW